MSSSESLRSYDEKTILRGREQGMTYKPMLDAAFWQRDAERAREQKERATKAEAFFKDLHEKRMREVDAIAKRDNVLYTDDENARRLKDLTPAESEALEATVTAQIKAQLSDEPPYAIYFEPKDGWHCTCDKCNIRRGRRE